MGYRLVRLALRPGLGVSPRARLVLVKMAELAHDGHDPPTYWGGWELLALTLDYPGLDHAGELAVTKAIRELRDAKLCTLAEGGSGRGRARYTLHLDLWD